MWIYQYLNCKIQPNHYIEDLNKYLVSIENNNVVSQMITAPKAFLSDEESFSIRVEVKDMELFDSLNYVCLKSLENEVAITRYYFVSAKQCVSEFVYDLVLQLDVVNTYQNQISNADNFKQVSMTRRHKDRWIEKSKGHYDRLLDKVDEGLGNVANEVENTTDMTSNTYNVCWYYPETHNSLSKYITRILPEDSTKLSLSQYHLKFDMSKDKYWPSIVYTHSGRPYSFLIKCKDKIDGVIKMITHPSDGNSTTCYANAFLYSGETGISTSSSGASVRSNGVLKPIKLNGLTLGTITDSFKCSISYSVVGEVVTDTQYLDIYANSEIELCCLGDNWEAGAGETVDISPFNGNTIDTIGVSSTTEMVYGKNSVSLVDSQIKSMQEIPCDQAVALYYGGGEALIAGDTITTTKSIQLKNYMNLPSKTATTRDIYYESKLYGSYVRNHYLAYDNYTLPVQPEFLDSVNVVDASITASLDMTNSYLIKCSNLKEKKLYSNQLVCSRNNGVATYNDSYMEYVRNGFNYDVKQKNMANIKNGIAIGVQAAQTAASLVLGGKALSRYAAIQAGFSAGTSLVGAITSGIENEQALDLKRQQLLATAPTISGNSGLALFDYYSGNKLKFVVEKPNDELLNSIWDMFYYSGYADNLFYNTMPSIKTREYFNYIQANVGNCTITDPKIRQRLVEALSEGITFEWHYNNTWLMNGELYENWETSI